MTMIDERWRVILGDVVRELERLDDASIDHVVCDPPYALGFMSREWDTHEDPRAFQAWCERWARECLRVLKPGGFLLAFGGTRTYHRLVCGVEDAGFEVRDRVLTLTGAELAAEVDWVYGSGWPKSRDIGKAIDARAGAAREVVGTRPAFPDGTRGARARPSATVNAYGDLTGLAGEVTVTAPATAEAAEWDGWGTALKPAHEPILVARKPFRGTVEANALEHGTGALNIDACRIASGASPSITRRQGSTAHLRRTGETGWKDWSSDEAYAADRPGEHLGRWPANVALIHAPGCQRAGERVVRGDQRAGTDAVNAGRSWLNGAGPLPAGPVVGDEVVEEWDCAPGCPVAMLDEVSGMLSSGAPDGRRGAAGHRQNTYMGECRPEGTPLTGYGDTGGASRFFATFQSLAAARPSPSLHYSGKTSPVERDAMALELLPRTRQARKRYQQDAADRWRQRARNRHPTVKPIGLMRWLIRLVARKGSVILDPFAGSGSTGAAAVLEGMRFVGIDEDPYAVTIARARVTYWARLPEGTRVDRALAQDATARRTADEATERRRELAAVGQLDLLAGIGGTDGLM